MPKLEHTMARKERRAGKIRLGWFSTWNSRCGIAEYSRYLLNEFDTQRFDWTVLASRNDLMVAADQGHVIRCWTDHTGSVTALLDVVLRERFDVLLINFKVQVGFDFLSLYQLESLIACCHSVGTKVVMILHATEGADSTGSKVELARIVESLSTVQRICVHSQADLDRLRAFGLRNNVEIFPQGCIDLGPPAPSVACRQAMRLPDDMPIIGSYGFLLPHKGIDKLIQALALLKEAGTRAKLLLVNALYPIPASEEYFGSCRLIADQRGVRDDVLFETRFLSPEISLRMLAACDVIVYPYQKSGESVSGAVRFGISSRQPIFCSPLQIFSEVSSVVRFLRGFRAEDIYQDLQDFLSDNNARQSLAERQADWIQRHSWQHVAQLLQEQLEVVASKRTSMTVNTWIGRYISDLQRDHELAETATAAEIAALDRKAREQISEARAEAAAQVAQSRGDALHWKALADSVYASTSWRLTAPMRRLGEILRSSAARLAKLIERGRQLGGRTTAVVRMAQPVGEPKVGSELSHILPPDKELEIAKANLSAREQSIYLDLTRAIHHGLH